MRMQLRKDGGRSLGFTIPKPLRVALGLRAGSFVTVRIRRRILEVVPETKPPEPPLSEGS